MPQFLLALHHGPGFMANLSPEEMQKAVEKYMAWNHKPFTIDSKRLAPDPGKVIRGSHVTDGPFSETKEVLGGFYLIQAANYDEAVARAKEHPHLEYKGSIEVRQLHQMHD